MQAPSNGKAIGDMVTGILGCCIPFIGLALAIVAIVLGILAKKEVDAQPGQWSDGSRGMAIAGIVLGIVALVIGLLFIAFVGTISDLVDAYCEDNPDEEACEDYQDNRMVADAPAPVAHAVWWLLSAGPAAMRRPAG